MHLDDQSPSHLYVRNQPPAWMSDLNEKRDIFCPSSLPSELIDLGLLAKLSKRELKMDSFSKI